MKKLFVAKSEEIMVVFNN